MIVTGQSCRFPLTLSCCKRVPDVMIISIVLMLRDIYDHVKSSLWFFGLTKSNLWMFTPHFYKKLSDFCSKCVHCSLNFVKAYSRNFSRFTSHQKHRIKSQMKNRLLLKLFLLFRVSISVPQKEIILVDLALAHKDKHIKFSDDNNNVSS